MDTTGRVVGGWRKGEEGLGRGGGGGLGVRKKDFQGVSGVERMGGIGWLVGWVLASLHGAAPSRAS